MNVESITNSGIHYRSIYATTECLNRTAETKTARSVRRVSDFVLVGKLDIKSVWRVTLAQSGNCAPERAE
jgi:hypothetical protein